MEVVNGLVGVEKGLDKQEDAELYRRGSVDSIEKGIEDSFYCPHTHTQ